MPINSDSNQWLEKQFATCWREKLELYEIEVQNMEAEERDNQQKDDIHDDDDNPDNTRWSDNWFLYHNKLLAPLGNAVNRMMEKTGRIIRSAGGGSVDGGIYKPINALPGPKAFPLR